MSTVHVTTGTAGIYEGSESELTMRVYVNQTFVTSDLESVIRGRLHSPNFYLSVPCTVAAGVVTYDAFDIDSTDDAFSDSKRTSYTFALYTNEGTFRSLVHKKIRVPAAPTPTTLGALVASSALITPAPPGTYPAAQVDALLALKADRAGDTFTGAVHVPDEAYDATAWNGSTKVPTQNAVRDKIEVLISGTFQPLDSDLVDIAALSPVDDAFIQRKAGAWTSRTLAQVKTDLGTAADDAAVLATAEAYADSLVVGLLDDRGNYDASVNTFPASGGSGAAGAIVKGDLWTVSVAGTLGGHAVTAGDVVRALVNTPGQTDANWAITENNFGYVAENSANKDTDSTFAANSDTKYPSQKAVKTALATKVGTTGNETIAGIKTFSDAPVVPADAYGIGWDGKQEPATKDAVYDKVEALIAGTPGTYTDEQAQDAVGAMVSGNTETGISVTYDDVANKLNFDAQTAGDLRYQPLDSDLTAIAALTPTNDDIIQRKAGAWTNRTLAQLIADLGLGDAMIFKGVIDCSASPNYPAADAGNTYKVSVAGKIGGVSGMVVEVGDTLICQTDGTASGTQAGVGANWHIVQVNIDGAVTGPATATDLGIALFDGTTGKIIKDSLKTHSTDGTFASNTDSKIPTEKAVKTYADTKVSKTGDETVAGIKTFSSAPVVPADAYAVGWNGKQEPAPKDAVYDKIEAVLAAAYTDEMAQDAVGAMVTGNTETGISVTYDDAGNKLNFAIDDEYVQDLVGAMVSGNTETNITVTYQDSDGTLDFVASAGGGSGIDMGKTLAVAAGLALP
jgi:hypothetical protein